MWLCRSPRMSAELDQLGSRACRRRAVELAAVLAQLRLDVGEAEPLVDLLLGRARARFAGGVVEDPVLGDVQAAAHGGLAQRGVVRARAGEVLQQVAELRRARRSAGRRGTPEWVRALRAAPCRRSRRSRSARARRGSATSVGRAARWSATRSMSLTLSACRRTEPASWTCVPARRARSGRRRAPRRSRARAAAGCAAPDARRARARLLERREHALPRASGRVRAPCAGAGRAPPRAAPRASRCRARNAAAARAWGRGRAAG